MEVVRDNVVETAAEVVEEIAAIEPTVDAPIVDFEMNSGIGWKEILTGAGVVAGTVAIVSAIVYAVRKNKKAKKTRIVVEPTYGESVDVANDIRRSAEDNDDYDVDESED
jgi:hypothetical protein